ncbi:MAG: SDR family NAD(P)-dependent oxidoreductase [Zetaproteobacteria bacterium]|nr:SDR family NAD(P)-dependent oxidoreductase [Zetaproteobacteria bacterium]
MKSASVVITGCSGGIGVALTQSFQKHGYWVIGMDRSSPPADAHIDHYIEFDLQQVLNEDKAAELKAEILHNSQGEVKCLVNNAAYQVVVPVPELSLEDWMQTLSINLLAPFFLTKALLPALERAVGSVINIASIHHQLTKPQFVAYATSKAALSGLTQAMAVELGATVRINGIAPAATDTPMLRSGFTDFDAESEALCAAHPQGRIAAANEVADVALFLASSSASFINGAIIPVDGGISSRLHDPV